MTAGHRLEGLKHSILLDKAVDFLVQEAIITEKMVQSPEEMKEKEPEGQEGGSPDPEGEEPALIAESTEE